jgi:hypothetical protein
MPLIQPPDEYEERVEPVSTPTGNIKPKRWYDWYLNVPNWICPECQATMFGRVKYCVYCKQRLHKDTPRPSDYSEGLPYEG